MNRTLLAGNTVSKFLNGKPVGQLGYCENVNVYTNVQLVTTSKMMPEICATDFNYTSVCICNLSKYINVPKLSNIFVK